MQATPVTWRLMLAAGWTPQSRFTALVGGEALPADLAEQLGAAGAELWNMYGPTETTVWSTCARVPQTADAIAGAIEILHLRAGDRLLPHRPY